MANTSSRTLRLLSLLQGQRYWPGAELADRLDVSVRTLRRDVERLRELGYPVQAHRGVDGGYQLAAGAVLPPLLLDDEEAIALAVALHAATASAVAGIVESSVRALAKVSQVMPPRLRRRVDAVRAMTVSAHWGGTDPEVDPGVLTTVALACRDDERLEISYTSVTGEHTERTVEPHRLVLLGRRWYLVGYDLTRHDWRSFRLDRLVRPTTNGVRFRPRELPAPDAATFVRRGIRTLPGPYDVQAVVHAPGADVRRRLGWWVAVEELDSEACQLRMRTDSLDWAALALGAAAADVSAVSPPELVAHLRQWADRFARAGCAGRKMSVLGRRLMAMGTAPRNSAICCRGYDGTPLSCGDGLQDRWSWPVRSATMGAVADDPALNRPIGWWLKKADGDLDAAFDRALLGSGRDVDRRRWQVLASLARRPTSRSAVVDALAAFDSASAVEGVVAELIQRGWLDEATGLLQLSPVGEREHAALAPLIDAVRL